MENIKTKTLFISLIMLCLVMLSLGATFAADDNVTDVIAVDDEIAIDEEVLAVEEDVQALSESESIIVTNDNLADVVSPDGGINENITADELIFKGTFEDLNLSVDRPIKVTGDEAVLINPDILIGSSNVTFSGFTITIAPCVLSSRYFCISFS